MGKQKSFDDQLWEILGEGISRVYISGERPGPEGTILTSNNGNSRGRSGQLKPFIADQSDSGNLNTYYNLDEAAAEHRKKNSLFGNLFHHISTRISQADEWLNHTFERYHKTSQINRQSIGSLAFRSVDLARPASNSTERKPNRLRKVTSAIAAIAILGSGISANHTPNEHQTAHQQIANEALYTIRSDHAPYKEQHQFTDTEKLYAWIDDHPGANPATALAIYSAASEEERQAVYNHEITLVKRGLYGSYNNELPVWLS